MLLEDDGYCFVCGPANPTGLNLRFEPSAAGGVRAAFTPGKTHQGYKNIVHGGIISTLLDEAMVKAAIEAGIIPVTVEITVRFKASLMVGEEATVQGSIETTGRLITARSELRRASDKKLIATGVAKLMAKK